MNGFKKQASHWNKHVFGNIFDRKYICLARLNGLQRKLKERQSQYLINLERLLKVELNEILKQEEALWKQKSRVPWLNEGEQNTHFCHLSIMRRRRNWVS